MTWVTARDSLWLIPSGLTLSGAGLALALIYLERNGAVALGSGEHWLLGGGAGGARAVLSTIAAGLVTVTGVVFSVTVVALQLASSQFTPRLLRNFVADRANQVVLGVFISTFTYALLVLRVVEGESADGGGFIPRVAVATGVILFLVSVACLVYFIHHASRSIRVPVILEQLTRRTLHDVRTMFPASIGTPSAEDELEKVPEEPADTISAEGSGYLQAVDAGALFQLGEQRQLVIRMDRLIGEYVLPETPLATVWPADAVDDAVVRQVRKAFVLGEERTPEQDVEFGIIEISDIAVKALSPGINDPRTALHCIDRLADVLYCMGTRSAPPNIRTREGRVHFMARPLRFERAAGVAFDQIRHFGAGNPAITKKLLDALGQLLDLLPPARHAPLEAQRAAIIDEAEITVRSPGDRADVHRLTRNEAASRRDSG